MERIENKGGYGVKGVKTQEGRNGYVFGGDLTLNDKKIGTFFDAGDGGAMDVNFENENDKTNFYKFLRTNWPDISEGGEPFSIFISMLSDEDEEYKRVKRFRNRKTFFFLKKEKSEYTYQLRELSIPYGPEALEYLENKFKDEVGGIGNEIFEIYPDNYVKA